MERVGSSLRRLALLCGAIALASCSGEDGAPGQAGPPGADGASCSVVNNGDGTYTITCGNDPPVVVSNGTDGQDGQDGGNAEITNFHGESFLLSTGEFLDGAKQLVNAQITGATADAAGVVSVDFTVTDDAAQPILELTRVNALIAKLVPPSGGNAWSRWVDYLQSVQEVTGSAAGDWPNPDGTKSRQGSRESNGTLTDHGNGQFTYRFATNISNVSVDGVAIPYQRNLTHRVQIMLGGHSGPTAEATFDFVPDGSGAVTTRAIVPTSACKKCHGFEFSGHGGDRLTMEGCVTCHSSDGTAGEGVDPHGGESIDMSVMIHKIHAGAELPGMAGPDGLIWDDPATPDVNEADDNGEYAMWGHGDEKAAWGTAEFPAVIENCTVCHEGTGAQVDNWKNVPSRKACGSCHADVDMSAHKGQSNDNLCSECHPAENPAEPVSVATAHDWTKQDIRKIPEFDVAVTLSTPGNGEYYVDGETPVITMVLSKNGTPIDHTTVIEDDAGEGCTPKVGAEATECNETADGKFRNANLYVTGPRASRVPVLHSTARAKVLSGTAGTWDLSAGGQSLRVVVDSGHFIVGYDPAGEDRLISGDFTVTLPAAADLGTVFANPAAATVDELVAWLMGDGATFEYNEREFHFRDRAIAYRDEATGRLAIRSRPTIDNTNIQIPTSTVATSLNQVLFTDHAVKVTGGASQVRARTTASSNDPKAVRTAGNITYTLDPIDPYMQPGTYVVNVEFADLGRGATSDSFRTPSIAIVTFQVKQAAPEKPIAAGCKNCHWSDVTGTGYILDYPRHNKVFDDRAMDQCGGCHDYASAETIAAPTWTTGGSTKPIARRVHSIHNGINLTYPVITVDHEESVPGRNWEIVYPMDVRDCESCHPEGETSGTWKTNPNRIACMGCHDTDAATSHMKAMTYDPTPTIQWNGDEEETCKACH
jgi:hypothetical protein